MERLLEQIRDLLLPKVNLSVVLSSDSTDWTTNFSPPLFLDPQRKYELALVNLETYNSISNVTATNNKFVYRPLPTEKWKTISLPVGSYELTQINTEVQRQLEVNGDWGGEAPITVGVNPSTLRAFIKITSPTYEVDMAASTMRTLLGFNPQTLTKGYREGDKPMDIMAVNSILVNSNLVNGSYLNSSQQPVVYSFFPGICPGYKIIESPRNLVFLPISQAGNVPSMRVWLTDQNGSQLDLRGERITIRFHIRSI